MDAGGEVPKSTTYQLDSSSRDLQYRPATDLPALRPSHREALQASLLTANDSLLCWAEGSRVWSQDSGRPQCVQDLGQPVVSLALRKDCGMLAVATGSQLLAQDLDKGALMMAVVGQEPGFRMVAWHPYEQRMLGVVYKTDLVVYQMSEQSDQVEPAKTKTLPQTAAILGFAFSPDSAKIVTVALEGGLIRTFDLQSEASVFEVRPHAFSPLFTNSLVTAHLQGKSLLTIGKSLNELVLWNWSKKEKEQTLNISAFTPELVTIFQSRCYLVDPQSKALAIVAIGEVGPGLRFTSVSDYMLETNAIKAVEVRVSQKGETELILLGNGTLEVFPLKDIPAVGETTPKGKSRSDRRKKPSASPQVPSDQLQLLQRRLEELQSRLDSGAMLSSIQNQVDKVINEYMEKLSNIIKDEQQKIQVSMKVLLAQAFKEQFQSAILPLFEAAVKEMFTQATLAFQEGVKEFTERNALEEAHFQSVMQHMKSSVEATTELTSKLGKLAFKQLKRVNDAELKLAEKAATLPQAKPEPRFVEEVPALKLELDRLLRNEEFEAAVLLVLSESDERVIYKVLRVLNPGALYALKPLSNGLSLRLCHRILTHFPARDELPEYLLWLQEICKNVVLKSEDPNIVQNILEMMVSRSKNSPELTSAKETFFSKIMQDMQERRR